MTYLFTECVIISCDPLDWLIQTCYQSASPLVTETALLTQKCFSVEELIIVSLNSVIPICYCLATITINGLFIAIQCLLLFKRSVSSNVHHVLKQTQPFSHDVP